MSAPRNPTKAIIAIDLGASETRVAINLDGVPHQCHFGRNLTSKTIPSVLYMQQNGERRIGDEPPGGEWSALKWFKLHLLHLDDWPERAITSSLLQNSADVFRSMNLRPVAVLGEYLRLLWIKVKHFVATQLGMSDAAFRELSLLLVMTVPAAWPQEAMKRTERAVSLANILESTQESRLTFMRETEACAMFVLNQPPQHLPIANIQEGDTFVICDCGELTVDTATYQVTVRSEQHSLIFEQVPGKHDICGGVFLVEGFLDCLKDKLRSTTGDQGILEKLDSRFWESANKWWEGVGRSMVLGVAEGTSVDFPCQVVYQGAPDLESNSEATGPLLSFSETDVAKIRDTVLNGILGLVNEQIQSLLKSHKEAPKFVFLTGRMGKCASIQGFLTRSLGKGIQVLRCPNASMHPVSRGAAMQAELGYHPDGRRIAEVESRLASQTYGILLSETGARPASWLLEKGVSISTTKPYQHKIPSQAFSIREYKAAVELILTVVSTDAHMVEADSSEPQTFCTIHWKKPARIAWPQETMSLEFGHDTYRGVSLYLCRQSKRIQPRDYEVRYS